jgi:putative heme-binding domain-containing protein
MIEGRGSEYIARAAKDSDAEIRVTALRAARRVRRGVVVTIRTLVHDPSPLVRRECAIALRNVAGSDRADLWAELALAHDGRDRWSLEALGIGADGDWDACLTDWHNVRFARAWAGAANAGRGPGKEAPETPAEVAQRKAALELFWRSRAHRTPAILEEVLLSITTPHEELPRLLRAFDFQPAPERQESLLRLAFGETRAGDAGDSQMIRAEAIARLDRKDVLDDPRHAEALTALVSSLSGTPRLVDLMERFWLPRYSPEVLAIAQANAEESLGVRAIRLLLNASDKSDIEEALNSRDPKTVQETIAALASSEDPRAANLLWPIADDAKRSLDVRRQAIRGVGRTTRGANEILSRAEGGKLEARLSEAASAAVYASASDAIRTRAAKVFPLPPAVDARPLPPVRLLLRRRGDVRKGEIVFATIGTCAKCHVVNGQGKEVGPNLSEIGAKLSRPALYESILFPSAAISHNFSAYTVVLTNGNAVSGILISRTPDSIAIRGTDAITRTYRTAEVEEIKEQSVSLMPADLQKTMTADDLVNMVEYLTTLKPRTQKAISSRTKLGKHE